MDEDRSRHIAGIWRQAVIEARIDLFGQGDSGAFTRDVIADGWVVNLQIEPGDELLMDRRKARIDVVDVNCRGIGRLRIPEVADRSGQSRSIPRTRWKFTKVAVLPVRVSRTSGWNG